MTHIYGPVPSRRLGRSLGVDLIPSKMCNYSCIYCQLGRTQSFINKRNSFFPKEEIFSELVKKIDRIGEDLINYITFVGNGEPTLSSDLGWFIQEVKAMYSVKTAVITNGALLFDETVRSELSHADVILPSYDAGSETVFRKINRPHRDLKLASILEGMIKFREEYRGQIWLEIMVVPGVNDDPEEIDLIKAAVEKIRPDRIYLNGAIRPPAEPMVKMPTKKELQQFKQRLGSSIDIVINEQGQFSLKNKIPSLVIPELIEIIKRHPMREEQVLNTLLEHHVPNSMEILSSFADSEDVVKISYEGCSYFEYSKYRGIWN